MNRRLMTGRSVSGGIAVTVIAAAAAFGDFSLSGQTRIARITPTDRRRSRGSRGSRRSHRRRSRGRRGTATPRRSCAATRPANGATGAATPGARATRRSSRSTRRTSRSWPSSGSGTPARSARTSTTARRRSTRTDACSPWRRRGARLPRSIRRTDRRSGSGRWTRAFAGRRRRGNSRGAGRRTGPTASPSA